MSKATKDSVVEAWSEKAGRKDQYDVREVETFDGDKSFQLIDKDTGSLTIQASSLEELQERAGDALIDPGSVPKESSGEDSEKHYTSRGVLAFPTQPENLNDPSDPVELNPDEQVGDKPSRPQDKITSSSVPSVKEAVKKGESNREA